MERCEGGGPASEDEARRKAARETSAAISRMAETLQKMENKQVRMYFTLKGQLQKSSFLQID
jgi:hypothetical protein